MANVLSQIGPSAADACGIAGWGVVRIPWQEIPQRRLRPGPVGGLNPAPHLKLAEEQTVVACAAILDACARSGWDPAGFGAWGIVAAPTYIGRIRLAPSLRRFQNMGARGVSPLIIPTLSNHSIAGTLCLILNSHGPNFGVGGSVPTVDEMLLNALSLADGTRCPGVWAVMTAWTPEPIPDEEGKGISAPATAVGVALALLPHSSAGAVHLVMPGTTTTGVETAGTVFELADVLEQQVGAAATWRCPLPGGGHLELTSAQTVPLRRAS